MRTWVMYWRSLTDPDRDELKAMFHRYHGLIEGIASDGTPRSQQVVLAVADMLLLEDEILEAHLDWLRRTRAKFDACGIPWTADELALHAELGDGE